MAIPAESTIHLHEQKFLIDNSKYIFNIQKLSILLNSYRNSLNIHIEIFPNLRLLKELFLLTQSHYIHIINF